MKILIVAKHSKYEWERKKFGLSHIQIVDRYSKEHANLDAIIKAHDKQKIIRDAFEIIMKSFDVTLVMMDTINTVITGYDLVIVLGGDNSFTNVSHYINDIPILGVNSDPERSFGHLLSYSTPDVRSVHKLREIIMSRQFTTQRWTRIQATLDGEPTTLATSEYFFGEKQRNKMSRHILIYNGQEYEQKCSGIIIATGAGSTGWYNSAKMESTRLPWKPTDNKISFVVTEPFNNDAKSCCYGDIFNDDEITLYSLNDDEGLVSVDSWEEYKFLRGSEIKVKIGKPLNVAMIQELV